MLASDSLSQNSMGGTELMKYRLYSALPQELKNEIQLIASRVEESLDETKIRILWLHDLPGDPASEHLKNGGWKKFHKLVFVSNWQMQGYISYYGIPWSHCIVLQNSIKPFIPHVKPNDGTIRIAYWSTPHRGLELLVPAFKAIAERRDNIVLDVYSSFSLYGWPQRDEPYKKLFEECENHPKINYHGSIPNEDLREHLLDTHIMAYPSIWMETSCLCLMEAMSAGLLCVHSNLGALSETSANLTFMYQYEENPSVHASKFATLLDIAIESYWTERTQSFLQMQKAYADMFYNFDSKVPQWEALIRSLMNEPRSLPQAEKEMFTYKI
jgi:glycosyltransferase involved in cell wall biosynthesis